MTAFIQGTKTVSISGGDFRQTSYSEQHDHHTQVVRDDRTVIQGNIYGYTHHATSDNGPIIAYSHTTNVTRPQSDEYSTPSFGRGGPSILPRQQIRQQPFNGTTPLIGNTPERLPRDGELTNETGPSFILPQTQHFTSEPFTLEPFSDDQELKAEYRTMSPEMRRYVIHMLGQLRKRTAPSSSLPHGPTFTDPKSLIDLQSDSAISKSTRPPATDSPNTTPATNETVQESLKPPGDIQPIRDVPANNGRNNSSVKRSLLKGLAALFRRLLKITARP